MATWDPTASNDMKQVQRDARASDTDMQQLAEAINDWANKIAVDGSPSKPGCVQNKFPLGGMQGHGVTAFVSGGRISHVMYGDR